MATLHIQVLLVHLLGRPATGTLARPFASQGGFMGMGAPAAEEPVAAATVAAVEEAPKETKKEKKSK